MNATRKSIAIMQPYFFPYIGYFQLLAAVDTFIFYDDVKYIKQGWVNRNRILSDGRENFLTLPVRRGTAKRPISAAMIHDPGGACPALLRKVEAAYRGAPHFASIWPVLEGLCSGPPDSIGAFNVRCVTSVARLLGLTCELMESSKKGYRTDLSGQERVIHICKTAGATRYVNAAGARAAGLYQPEAFAAAGLALEYLIPDPAISYDQGVPEFHANLSIIDVLMFNGIPTVRTLLEKYRLEPA